MVGVALFLLDGCGGNSSVPDDAGFVAPGSDSGGEASDATVADAPLGDIPLDLADGAVRGDALQVADTSLLDSTTNDEDGPARIDARGSDAPPSDDVLPISDSASDATDVALLACASLRTLIDKGNLIDRNTRQVRFSPDGEALLLRVIGGDASGSDEVLLVQLPGGSSGPSGRGCSMPSGCPRTRFS